MVLAKCFCIQESQGFAIGRNAKKFWRPIFKSDLFNTLPDHLKPKAERQVLNIKQRGQAGDPNYWQKLIAEAKELN